MNPLTLALGALSLLTLLALVIAVTALWQVRCVARKVNQRPPEQESELATALQALRSELEEVASRVHDAPPAQALPAAVPRNGMNLAKRSQALRLNRHGNSPAQIASSLDVPLQEVELLLKVDRIVLSNV